MEKGSKMTTAERADWNNSLIVDFSHPGIRKFISREEYLRYSKWDFEP
jgi:hypothetical protein